MSDSFLNLLTRLNDAGVDFVIIGGFANIVHGCTMVTEDVDICCDFSVENLLRLQKAIADINPVHRMSANKLKLELTGKNCTQFKNLYLDTDIGQLDCINSVDGLGDYTTIKHNSQLIQAGNIKLRVLNIDSLIQSKKTMGRPRDREAVIQLEAIKKLKNKKTQ